MRQYVAQLHFRPRNRRAFTLVELVIVVLIIGILAAVTAPKFAQTLVRSRADAAAKRIRADLAWARQHAVSSSSTQTVQFFPASESYQIDGLDDLDHSGQSYSVDLTSYPYHSEVVTATLGGDSNVQFNIHGQPDSGGVITVQAGTHQQTVTVDALTGEVTVP